MYGVDLLFKNHMFQFAGETSGTRPAKDDGKINNKFGDFCSTRSFGG